MQCVLQKQQFVMEAVVINISEAEVEMGHALAKFIKFAKSRFMTV